MRIRIKKNLEEHELLRRYKKGRKNNFSIFLFALCFCSIGIAAFVLLVQVQSLNSRLILKDRLKKSIDNVIDLYDGSYLEQDSLIKTEYLKQRNFEIIGPKDLSLKEEPRLIEVKALKKALNQNISKIRFVKN